MKRIITIVLSIVMLATVCSVGITAQALNVKYMSIDDLNIQGETRTVYFYMPDYWKNEYNYCYDEAIGLDSCKPAINWETGSYNCTEQGYDGYYLTEEVYDNIFVAEIPKDVEYFKFDNTVSVLDYDGYTPSHYVRSTDELGVVYNPDETAFDFYSDGRTNVDNMIVVVSEKYSDPKNEISPQCVEAFYYYGDGKYGYEPTLEEAGKDVFTGGEFPVFYLRVKADKKQIYFGETATITPNRKIAKAVLLDTDMAEIEQDPETGVVTLKAGEIQGYVSVKFEYQYNENSLVKTVNFSVWVQNPKKYSTLDEANIQGDTIKTYFYMPDDWRNENSLCYDETIGLESCHPSIYWWTINSEGKVEYNSGGTYVVTETVADNVYLAKIPANTYGLMWLNSMPSDYFSNGTHEITYDDIGKEYDDYGYYYPNGLESFDNMVTIPFYYQDNNFDQINGYVSRSFYYYGDGKYGYEPTLEQAGEDVFSDGEIPVFNLRAKAEKNIVKTGETITITPSRAKAIATIDNTDVATIQQNPETGVVTLTGVSEGTAKVNFSYQFSEYTPVFEASVEIKVENEYIVDKVKLSKTSFTYNGKKKTPSVTAIDTEGRTLKKGTDYIVTYSKGCKNVGKYTAKVVFKGKYKGTKILNFKIVPKSTKIKEIKGAKKSLTVKWTKIKTQADGYQLQYSTNAKFKSAGKKTVKNITKTTISKLKSNKKYFVRIRTYKTVKGKKYYSQWSKTVSRKTK